jgi:hypothetical protein
MMRAVIGIAAIIVDNKKGLDAAKDFISSVGDKLKALGVSE